MPGDADYTVIHDVAWLQHQHAWPGLMGVVIVESQREIDGKSSAKREGD